MQNAYKFIVFPTAQNGNTYLFNASLGRFQMLTDAKSLPSDITSIVFSMSQELECLYYEHEEDEDGLLNCFKELRTAEFKTANVNHEAEDNDAPEQTKQGDDPTP